MNLAVSVHAIRAYRAIAKHPFAFPGGYRINFHADDGATICAACVGDKSNGFRVGGAADGFRIEGTFIHWEGPAEICAACNAELSSEYGDPAG